MWGQIHSGGGGSGNNLRVTSSSQHQALKLPRIPRRRRWQSPRRRSCLRLHRLRLPAARAMFEEKESEKAIHKTCMDQCNFGTAVAAVSLRTAALTHEFRRSSQKPFRHLHTPNIRVKLLGQRKRTHAPSATLPPPRYKSRDFQAQPRKPHLLGVLG